MHANDEASSSPSSDSDWEFRDTQYLINVLCDQLEPVTLPHGTQPRREKLMSDMDHE